MIPIGDDNPTRTKPYVVYALIIANVLVYLVDILGPAQSPLGGYLWNWSMVPYSLVHNAPVVKHIAVLYGNVPRLTPVVYHGLDPMWATVFTSMFMHGGLLHIGGNMLYLWVFGNNIEEALGHFKFLIFYLVCGVAAALAQVVTNVNSTVPMVGASGAIAGVLGAYLLLYPRANVRTLVFIFFFITFVEIPALIVLGLWFVLQLTGVMGTGMTVGGGVAYWAHIGGFVAGLGIISMLGGKALATRRSRYVQRPYDDDRPYPFRPWR